MVSREGMILWRNCNERVTTFVIVLHKFKKGLLQLFPFNAELDKIGNHPTIYRSDQTRPGVDRVKPKIWYWATT